MSNRLQLKSLVTVWLLLFWSVAAFAAQATFVGDLRDIPPAAVAISILLAIIGGSAYSAQKVADVNIKIKSVPLEVVKDLLTSIVVGLLIFCLGSYLEWPSVVQAGFITLGGYGGSRVLEPLLGVFMKRGSQLFGVDQTALPSVTPPAPDSAPPPPNGEPQ
jgi:ABC-type xylose transport system permease subunit